MAFYGRKKRNLRFVLQNSDATGFQQALSDWGIQPSQTPPPADVVALDTSAQQVMLENMMRTVLQKEVQAKQAKRKPTNLAPSSLPAGEEVLLNREERQAVARRVFGDQITLLERAFLTDAEVQAVHQQLAKGHDPDATLHTDILEQELTVLQDMIIPLQKQINSIPLQDDAQVEPVPMQPQASNIHTVYAATQQPPMVTFTRMQMGVPPYAGNTAIPPNPQRADGAPQPQGVRGAGGNPPPPDDAPPDQPPIDGPTRREQFERFLHQAGRWMVRIGEIHPPHPNNGMLTLAWLIVWFTLAEANATSGTKTRYDLLLAVMTSQMWLPPPDVQAVQQYQQQAAQSGSNTNENTALTLMQQITTFIQTDGPQAVANFWSWASTALGGLLG